MPRFPAGNRKLAGLRTAALYLGAAAAAAAALACQKRGGSIPTRVGTDVQEEVDGPRRDTYATPLPCTRMGLMGQRLGRTGRRRSHKLERYQVMAVQTEEEEEECTENVTEKHEEQLKAIWGKADSRNGAVGLYNIGLSCCLNSLLQVFFMNRHFTMILRRIKVPYDAAEQKGSVPYQMLLLLEEMQKGKQKSVHPTDLARCLSKHNVKLFILYDASQLFLILWNLIKDQITSPDLAEHLIRLYTIQLQENTMCQECFLETKKDSNMLILPLPMFDFDSQPLRTLEDALRLFFAPELLTEENTFCCEQCDKRTSCLRDVKITCLPKTLILHLMRFCSKDGHRTKKISHSLSFPPSLDFSQILSSKHYCPDTQEKDSGLYDLFAVVAHSGLADFGHYCAYVWSLTEHKWFCFNDSSVCQVSWDDVKCTYGRASLRWGETAYLLVYLKRNCKQL